MLQLGILCSGKLGLQTLLKIANDYTVIFVLTDKNSKEIIGLCKISNIPCFAGNPRDGIGFSFIKKYNVDIIASINYLFLIQEDVIEHSNILTFNIHGSLLPKYRGRTPHVWAIINGEKKAGITAHVIDSGCDTGKIIHQIEVSINEEDTGGSILEKYSEAYFPIIKKVLTDVTLNQITLQAQDESEASFYGKRTPSDGEINWGWSKESIKNWVRAQAHPYPGAFTFYDGRKIIIDKISFVNTEIKKDSPNGLLLKTSPKTIVKTKNGAIQLESIRTENCIFEEGKKFENESRK